MTGADLIVAAPWLVFAAGLAMIGWRLAAGRSRRQRRSPRRHTATGLRHRRSWDAEGQNADIADMTGQHQRAAGQAHDAQDGPDQQQASNKRNGQT